MELIVTLARRIFRSLVSDLRGQMPHRRRMERGSFAGHFDALVSQFPAHAAEPEGKHRRARSAELQEKLDIHAALFERAWQLEGRKDS